MREMVINDCEELVKWDGIRVCNLEILASCPFSVRIQIQQPLDDCLDHKPGGGKVGALHSDLGIVLGNQDEDRHTVMIGEGQLLFVLADLPGIKGFNDIFEEGDQ